MNTVKVRRISSVAEEAKDSGQRTQRALEGEGNDYLLNYTFDLSLDDHMRTDND